MRIRTAGAAALVTCGVVLSAQGAVPKPAAPAPSTEIFLAPFKEGEGKTTRIAFLVIQKRGIEVGRPLNITNSPADDDEPCFPADSSAVFFSARRDAAPTGIYRYDIAAKSVTRVLPPEGRDCAPPKKPADTSMEPGVGGAVTPDGAVLMGRNSKVLLWHDGEEKWIEIADLGKAGLEDITRVAVSPDGKWIAFAAGQVVK